MLGKICGKKKTWREKKNGLSFLSINWCFNLMSVVFIPFCATGRQTGKNNGVKMKEVKHGDSDQHVKC